MKTKNITIDELAAMVAKGFDETNKNLNSFKTEMYEFRSEMNDFRSEMNSIVKDNHELRIRRIERKLQIN